MKLKDYFELHKIKPTPWGLKNGIYPALLSRYLNGKGISPANAAKIEQATDGQVDKMELLYPEQEGASN